MEIDLNADLGEDFGAWRTDRDRQIIPLVSSANIACGFHAGDPRTIDRAVGLCARHGVAVGAHVSYPDLVGFGRRKMELSTEELMSDVIYQIGAVSAFCRLHGLSLNHVKPHGALYNVAAVDHAVASAIAQAVVRLDPRLIVYALPGSALAQESAAVGLTVAAEGFCDRAYRADGTLIPRSQPGAVISDPVQVTARAVGMATNGEVVATDGTVLRFRFDTLCLHGDTPESVYLATRVREALAAAGVIVRAPVRRIQ